MVLLTPRMIRTGERLHLNVSKEDLAKVGRGRNWPRAIVTDLDTGQSYKVRPASCGSPNCFCDAIAEPIAKN